MDCILPQDATSNSQPAMMWVWSDITGIAIAANPAANDNKLPWQR